MNADALFRGEEMSMLQLVDKRKYHEDLLWALERTYDTIKSNQQLISPNDSITTNLKYAVEQSIDMTVSSIKEINIILQEITIRL